jgi:hypothetical protein
MDANRFYQSFDLEQLGFRTKQLNFDTSACAPHIERAKSGTQLLGSKSFKKTETLSAQTND